VKTRNWGTLKITALCAALAAPCAGCSGRTAEVLQDEEPSRVVPQFFVTGRVGTAEVAVRTADPDGTRLLAEFDLSAEAMDTIHADELEPWLFTTTYKNLYPSPEGSAAILVFYERVELVEATGGTWTLPLAHDPFWSPDGRKVAFYDEDHALHVADRATRSISRVHEPKGCSPFVWSPDGERFAYISRQGGDCSAPGELRVVDADGTDDHAVHGAALFCDRTGYEVKGNAVWSADGAYLAFVEPPSLGLDGALSGGVTFHVARADGKSGGARVERSAEEYDAQLDSGLLNRPASCEWAPAGNRLAISGEDLQVVSADGSWRRTLDTTSWVDDYMTARWQSMTWAPDGQHITRISHDGGGFVLRTVAVGGDTAPHDVPVRDEASTYVSFKWSADGKSLLHEMPWKDDEALALFDTTTGRTDLVTEGAALFGFNRRGSRFLVEKPARDLVPAEAFVREVRGGPALEQPSDVRGWLSDDAVLVSRDADFVARAVDGSEKEFVVWSSNDEERLLLLRPYTGYY